MWTARRPRARAWARTRRPVLRSWVCTMSASAMWRHAAAAPRRSNLWLRGTRRRVDAEPVCARDRLSGAGEHRDVVPCGCHPGCELEDVRERPAARDADRVDDLHARD